MLGDLPRRARNPTLGAAGALLLVASALVVGLAPLSDTSFFTHLATGRLILRQGGVPSVDAYTFSASGTPWVVQSWLASYLYASAEALSGAAGLRILMGSATVCLTLLAWRLLRPASSLLVRLGLGALFVAVGADLWSERPLMIGMLALACVLLAVHDHLDPRWLVPIGWIWVNSHGSFPLGVAYLVVLAVGTQLDGDDAKPSLRVLGWLLAGFGLGALGPLGLSGLRFPFQLVGRQDVLRHVIEWQAPAFVDFSQRLFLLQVTLAILLLVRRPSYRGGLVTTVFLAAALLGSRNVSVASLVLLPQMATSAPELGSLRAEARGRLAPLLAAAGLALCVLLGAVRMGQPDFELEGQPIDALAFIEQSDVDLGVHRLVTPETVGNLRELIYGADGLTFYDDRFDMFPKGLSADYLAIAAAGPLLRRALADHGADLVLWQRSQPTAQRLISDPAWRTLYTDESWVVVCRRGSGPGTAPVPC